MKAAHDKNHREVEFAVGDWAWLRLHQRTASGITARICHKLAPCYYGPFQVLERIGSVAYRLLLPPRARIHDVFHVVFLKKHHGEPPAAIVPLPPIGHGRALPVRAAVVHARPTKTSWELLVQWEGRATAEATWEDLTAFKERYPTFQLEDKLFSQGSGSIMDTFFGKKFYRMAKGQAPPGDTS
ncbi:hypothetical protein SEVIR_2G307401v4 [Setaria viridis]